MTIKDEYETFCLNVFGFTIRVETNCREVRAGLEAEWAGFATRYGSDGPMTRIWVTRYRDELEFCHARHHRITQEGASAWPCKKCVGDILFDASPDKHFVAYTDDVDAVISEVGWVISHVAYRHLPSGTIALHASAVVDHAGTGVMFLGPSDAGKSTLAVLMVAEGWQLISNEITYVEFAAEPRIRGLPSPIRLEPRSMNLVRSISGVDPSSRLFRPRAYGPRFSEVEAGLRLIVLPSLSPDRPLRIGPSAAEHTLTQLALRRIGYAIYRQTEELPSGWAGSLVSRVPAWTLDGRLDGTEAPEWVARAARGEFGWKDLRGYSPSGVLPNSERVMSIRPGQKEEP